MGEIGKVSLRLLEKNITIYKISIRLSHRGHAKIPPLERNRFKCELLVYLHLSRETIRPNCAELSVDIGIGENVTFVQC